jgi:hypothetical protein
MIAFLYALDDLLYFPNLFPFTSPCVVDSYYIRKKTHSSRWEVLTSRSLYLSPTLLMTLNRKLPWEGATSACWVKRDY